MKYLLLALTSTVVALSFSACSDDITASHDIYRAQYQYTPLPQQDVAAPTPSPNAAPSSSLAPPQL